MDGGFSNLKSLKLSMPPLALRSATFLATMTSVTKLAVSQSHRKEGECVDDIPFSLCTALLTTVQTLSFTSFAEQGFSHRGELGFGQNAPPVLLQHCRAYPALGT